MFIKNQNPDYDLTQLIIIDVISSVIFLLPRYIALCYVNSKSKVPRPQNIMYVNQWTIKYKQINIMIGLIDIKLRIFVIYIYISYIIFVNNYLLPKIISKKYWFFIKKILSKS